MENKSVVKIIQHELNSLNLQSITRDISVHLFLQTVSHHLPVNYWMKVNNYFFLDIAQANRAAATNARAATNEAARTTTYPARPVAGATAEAWKTYSADSEVAEREIKIVALVIEHMREAMPTNLKSNMDALHIHSTSTVLTYWLQPQVYGTTSDEQKQLEFEKLLGPVKVPTTETEKEDAIQQVDASFTSFFTSCFPEGDPEVERLLRKFSLSKCVKATALESQPLQVAVSLLNATYTSEELANTLKNVTRNHSVSSHGSGANVAKGLTSSKSSKLDPSGVCVLHPNSSHLSKDCFVQKDAAKEKAKKKAAAKDTKAKAASWGEVRKHHLDLTYLTYLMLVL